MTPGATPVIVCGGNWRFVCDAGQIVVAGQAFDHQTGYRVALGFAGATVANSLSTVDARLIAASLRAQSHRDIAITALVDKIEHLADTCDRLNSGWHALGCPADGFESQPVGHA